MEYKNILTGVRGSAGIITLNRPKALNAVCESMLEEIAAQVAAASDAFVVIGVGVFARVARRAYAGPAV